MDLFKAFAWHSWMRHILFSFPMFLVGAVALAASPVHADVSINILKKDYFDTEIQISGSLLNLPTPYVTGNCARSTYFRSFDEGLTICSGITDFNLMSFYHIDPVGAPKFLPLAAMTVDASDSTGIATLLKTDSDFYYPALFGIDSNYVEGTQFFSSLLLRDISSLSIGYEEGLIGSWSITGSNNVIRLYLGPSPSSVPVPGPSPLMAVATAWTFSRRLRRRISPKQR
jgi:hypothetical protein